VTRSSLLLLSCLCLHLNGGCAEHTELRLCCTVCISQKVKGFGKGFINFFSPPPPFYLTEKRQEGQLIASPLYPFKLTLRGRLHIAYSIHLSHTRVETVASLYCAAVSILAKELYKLYTAQSIFNKFGREEYLHCFPLF
jgi:hypothetical protein